MLYKLVLPKVTQCLKYVIILNNKDKALRSFKVTDKSQHSGCSSAAGILPLVLLDFTTRVN